MEDKVKICHFTSVHTRYDIRIFQKECVSLAKKYKVTLIVADNKGDELKDGIEIIDVGKDDSRLARIIKTPRRMYKILKKSDFAVYHFHDPELLPIAKKLIKRGKKVIYDVHEDVPRQILAKYWINRHFRKLVSNIFDRYEKRIAAILTGIITSTPYIADIFKVYNNNTREVCNYPILSELLISTDWKNRRSELIYIGGINSFRGIYELVDSLEHSECTLNLAGEISPPSLYDEISVKKGWENVNFYGFVDRNKVRELLSVSKIGILTLYPQENIINSLPIKLFEYMAAGIPVIASKIELWENIINEHQCGICVNPKNPTEIAEKSDYLLNNEEEAMQLGINGQNAVKNFYNWEQEEPKLLEFYKQIVMH